MKPKSKCTICGRPMASSHKVADALALVSAGVRPAAAARVTGISRQLLKYHMDSRHLKAPAGWRKAKLNLETHDPG